MNIIDQSKKIAGNIITILVVGFVLIISIIIGIESCTINPILIKEDVLFERFDTQGERDRVILTTDNEMFLTKQYNEIEELGYYKLEGSAAKHYFGGLYCIGKFPFGLRYYNNAENVIDGELKLVFKNGNSFPEVGDEFYTKIVIFKDRAIIGKHTYTRLKLNDDEKQTFKLLRGQFKDGLK